MTADYEYTLTETTKQVSIALHEAHDLLCFESYSFPEGKLGSRTAEMATRYGIEGHDYPILQVITTWELTDTRGERKNEETRYWLMTAKREEA